MVLRFIYLLTNPEERILCAPFKLGTFVEKSHVHEVKNLYICRMEVVSFHSFKKSQNIYDSRTLTWTLHCIFELKLLTPANRGEYFR